MNKILDVDANSVMVLYVGQVVKLEGKEWLVKTSGPIVGGWYQAELEPWGWQQEPTDTIKEIFVASVLGNPITEDKP